MSKPGHQVPCWHSLALMALLAAVGACGSGVPITLRIDDFQFTLSLDEQISTLEASLAARGILPNGSSLPERWPDTLPQLEQYIPFNSPIIPLNFNLNDPVIRKRYKAIERYAKALQRIDINELVIRTEINTLNLDLPVLRLEGADKLDTSPYDRGAWLAIGEFPQIPAQQLQDNPLQLFAGGESFLNAQLSDKDKQIALRAKGSWSYNTSTNPLRPTGAVGLRMILQVTFTVDVSKI